MEAIILAAGSGSRAAEATGGLPKCLVDIGGAPILFRQIRALQYVAASIYIVVGYRQEMIKERVRGEFPSMPIIFIENSHHATSNTLYSLSLAVNRIKTDAVIQLNGDVIFDPGFLSDFLKSLSSSRLAVRYGQCGDEEMKVRCDERGIIKEVNKQVSPHEAVGEAIGINLFCGDFLDQFRERLGVLSQSHAHEYFEYAVEEAIKRGGQLFPHAIEPYRAIEIDFPEDLRRARMMFSV